MSNRHPDVFYPSILCIVIASLTHCICASFCMTENCGHGVWLVRIVIAIFIILNISLFIHDYYKDNPSDHVRMKFKHFVDIYNINPDRWIVHGYGKSYLIHVGRKEKWTDTEHTKISFSFIDWLRYKSWYKNRIKVAARQKVFDANREKDEKLAHIIKLAQNDINKAYEKMAAPDEKISESEPAKEYNISDTMISDNYKRNGGNGAIYNQFVKIDSRYSIYNESNTNEKYLYDEHTGTYIRIT